MLSNQIVGSDAFISLSINAQALYFHLCMEADNRGYVNNARRIIAMFDNMALEDLKELVCSKFVLDRGKGLYLIKHWYIHNDIPTTRVEETTYYEDLENIYFDINNAYTTTKTEKKALDLLKKRKPFKESKLNESKINESKVKENKVNESKINNNKVSSNSYNTHATSLDDEQLF